MKSMSLVRSAESSAMAYGTSNFHSMKGSNNATSLSIQTLDSDEQKAMYTFDSYSSESYENYFLDSPTEEPTEVSYSTIYSRSFHPQVDSYQLRAESPFDPLLVSTSRHSSYPSNAEKAYVESQSSDLVDFDEDQIRLKLQELERALLGDTDVTDYDDEAFISAKGMDIDGEWSDSIRNELSHDSPKESSSSDSYLSGISSEKNTSQVILQKPKQLLLDCAAMISEGNVEEASAMISHLRQMVSIQGDPPQRIAAYMVEGLVARMADSGKFLYKALKCKEATTSDRLAAMQILFEVCPCFKFGFMTANFSILEACKDEKRVHIIDFDINQGTPYMALIQMLKTLPGKPPHLRLTGVDDPETVQRPVGGLKNIGQRLEMLAKTLGVSFEFQAVASKTSIVTPSKLDCRPGEAVIVNFAFQLHHMPDESVSTINMRDQLLRMVKSLKPKLVTVVEQDINTNTNPFFTRFIEAYNYYSAVFESLDVTLPRESQDRMNVERQCLARDIVNIVACEGEERIERYEMAGKWRARMAMAGFTSCAVSSNTIESIKKLIGGYCDKFKVKEEMGGLHFGWEDKNLIVASAWR